MYGGNFESGNLLNTWLKFWVWKLIEYMAKILSLDTYWIHTENFGSGNIESLQKILCLENYWIHG